MFINIRYFFLINSKIILKIHHLSCQIRNLLCLNCEIVDIFFINCVYDNILFRGWCEHFAIEKCTTHDAIFRISKAFNFFKMVVKMSKVNAKSRPTIIGFITNDLKILKAWHYMSDVAMYFVYLHQLSFRDTALRAKYIFPVGITRLFPLWTKWWNKGSSELLYIY